ncbi:MAG: tRNA (adenosine(37)-N6)-threonylcarbamoyltransferase complex ATPase subunit type 1 TsaE [Proteobacteria bacterium]|nr:tRNA (adenosine(37)-N6)-threonylcarbamoyltransferase complex ATPase subunit type 1 TsaE [Pseudomonadota bacterium]
METLGQCLAPCLAGVKLVGLKGDLGAGKTTLVRGVLRGMGYDGATKSPTFSLVEPYDLEQRSVYHFDLYRLQEAEELEYMGIRDYFEGEGLLLVEWPEKGAGILPSADLELILNKTNGGRTLTWFVHTPSGQQAIEQFLVSC